MTRSTITRRAAVGGIALLTLAACGSNDEDLEPLDADEEVPGEAEDPDQGEDPEEQIDEDEEAEADDEAPAAESTEVEIGETFTDEETGDSFTIVSAIRDMPSEYDSIYIEEGGEVVYLQIEFSPGEEFGGAIGTNDFYILYDSTEDRAKGTLRDEIEEAGHEPLETASRRDGDAGPLWMAFTVEGERQDTYTAAYIRPETEIIGSDETLPEFRHEFEIPAP